MIKENTSEYILRVTLALLLFYFGSQQILGPDAWTSYVDFNPTNLNDIYLVLLNGSFEIFMGILILFGVYLKPVAFIMGLHTLLIATMIGFTPTGARDLAIAGAFFALSFLKKSR